MSLRIDHQATRGDLLVPQLRDRRAVMHARKLAQASSQPRMTEAGALNRELVLIVGLPWGTRTGYECECFADRCRWDNGSAGANAQRWLLFSLSLCIREKSALPGRPSDNIAAVEWHGDQARWKRRLTPWDVLRKSKLVASGVFHGDSVADGGLAPSFVMAPTPRRAPPYGMNKAVCANPIYKEGTAGLKWHGSCFEEVIGDHTFAQFSSAGRQMALPRVAKVLAPEPRTCAG